jgi:protein O-GlcNAc transferase
MRISRSLVMLLVLLLTASLIAQDNAAKEKFNAGIKAKDARNFAEAEEQFMAATAAFPQYKEAWNQLGVVRHELKKAALAEEAFQKAIAIDPKYQQAFYNLGMMQLRAKKYTLAEASLKKSLELVTNDAKTMKALGQLYLLQKNYDKSVEYYKMYNSGNSTDAEAHYNLAQVYKEKGDLAEAEKSYQAAVRVDPKYAQAYFNYGNLLATEAKLHNDSAQISEKEGNSAEAEESKRAADRKFRAAISAYKSAIAADPGSEKAYYNLALSYMKTEQYPEALQAYKGFIKAAKGKSEFKAQVQQVEADIIPKLEETIQGQ